MRHFLSNDCDMRTRPALRLGFVILLFPVFGLSQCFGQVAHPSVATPNSSDIATARKDAPPKVAEPPPTCPPGGILPLRPGSPGTGDHTVTLWWNASVSPPHSESGAVGYCLYRSRKQSAARKNPTCATCERVNAVPVASLSCVDNVVEDGVTYYYVVIAINSASMISSSSNEVKVPIRRSREEKSTSGNSPPLCRVNSFAR
jgi:hypothetical protein